MTAGVGRVGAAFRHGALLALETAGSGCSAAVLSDSKVLAAERRPLRHGHAEALLPMIERVMARAGIAPAQLQTVSAALGPGGFTGIRVGLAAAHGIALASGAQMVGVTSFAAVAARLTGFGAEAPEEPRVLVALDSRRADLYVQLFAGNPARPLAPAQALLPDQLARYIAERARRDDLLIAGDAAETAAAALDPAMIAVVPGSAPDALGVAAAALALLRRGDRGERPRPFYLRPPDVTMPRPPAAATK